MPEVNTDLVVLGPDSAATPPRSSPPTAASRSR